MSEKTIDLRTVLLFLWNKYGGANGTPEDFNRLIRGRVPARGERFPYDHHDTFMYIERSKNRNIVAYTARMLDADTKVNLPSGEGCRCVANPKDPIHGYFINIESLSVEGEKRKGKTTDISELNMLERMLAYGCTGKPVNPSEKIGNTTDECRKWWGYFDLFAVSYVALPHWATILLVLPPIEGANDSLPVLLFYNDNELSVMQRVYVKSVEPVHFYQLPKVLYIEIFGISIETGEETYIKKLN